MHARDFLARRERDRRAEAVSCNLVGRSSESPRRFELINFPLLAFRSSVVRYGEAARAWFITGASFHKFKLQRITTNSYVYIFETTSEIETRPAATK